MFSVLFCCSALLVGPSPLGAVLNIQQLAQKFTAGTIRKQRNVMNWGNPCTEVIWDTETFYT